MLQDFTAGENKEFYTFRQACQVVTQQKTKGKEWWLDCFDQLTDWSLYFDFLYPLCPVSHHQSGLHKNTLLIQSFMPNVLSIYNGVKNAFNFYNTLNDWSQCQKSPFHLSRLFFFSFESFLRDASAIPQNLSQWDIWGESQLNLCFITQQWIQVTLSKCPFPDKPLQDSL